MASCDKNYYNTSNTPKNLIDQGGLSSQNKLRKRYQISTV